MFGGLSATNYQKKTIDLIKFVVVWGQALPKTIDFIKVFVLVARNYYT